jgi:glutamate 5-kinase
VLNLVAGDLLVILTDVDGLFAEAPKPGAPAPPPIGVVEAFTAEVERAAQGSSSAFGRGGMTTKLEAARAAARCGAATVVCNGATRDVAFTARTRGEVVIDEGAARALVEQGKSLLAAGIAEVRGEFGIGDAVTCVDAGGSELARGLVAYSADEIRRVARLPARRIPQVLGYSNGDEVIHRDDLVLLQETPE